MYTVDIHVHINFKDGMSFLVMEICMPVLFELDINPAYHIKVCLTRATFTANISCSWGENYRAACPLKSRVTVIFKTQTVYIVSFHYSYSHAIAYMYYIDN